MTPIRALIRRIVDDGVDLAYLLGCALVVAGFGLHYAPLGFIAAGACCLVTALLLAIRPHVPTR